MMGAEINVPQNPASLNRGAICCCGVAIVSLIPVLLFQINKIRRLPDPPGTLFDSERIVTSKEAFPLGIPDGGLGVASYAATLALLLADSPSKADLRKLVKAKLIIDGGMAATSSVRQLVRFRKVCSWCMGTVFGTMGMLYYWHRAHKTLLLPMAHLTDLKHRPS